MITKTHDVNRPMIKRQEQQQRKNLVIISVLKPAKVRLKFSIVSYYYIVRKQYLAVLPANVSKKVT